MFSANYLSLTTLIYYSFSLTKKDNLSELMDLFFALDSEKQR